MKRTIIGKSESNCKTCNKLFNYLPSRSPGTYCSIICRANYLKNVQSPLKFSRGEISDRGLLKKLVVQRDGYFCSVCNLVDWQGKPLTLQLDHTDGNAANNMPTNLRLICPNCHTQTPNYGGKNKGNGRKSRGLPLY